MHGVAVLPEGLELLGAEELIALGASNVHPLRRSVAFKADMACLYRLYLKSRLPFRLLRRIATFECDGPESLYQRVQEAIQWKDWLHPSKTLRVDISGFSNHLPNSYFTALQVKNALVDLQRDLWGLRSDIDLQCPDLCIHLHLNSNKAVLSLDGSGGSLHRRGYKTAIGLAPLKENIAAGLIRMTGWDLSKPLIDPLCGSATFLIEAASIALDLAPSINRKFCLTGWADFDEELWEVEKELACRIVQKEKKCTTIIGYERDENIAKQAIHNIRAAGLHEYINIENKEFKKLRFPLEKGLIVTNPPYGKRIGFDEDLDLLYQEFGSFLKRQASGWELWLLSGNPTLTRSLKMKANRKFVISNGGIDCRWLNYSIY